MGEDTKRSGSNASVDSNISVTPAENLPAVAAINYAQQAQRLSHVPPGQDSDGSGVAIKAEYITPQDPIIITADGGRLPGVPLVEAEKLNSLKAGMEGEPSPVAEDAPPSKTRPNNSQQSEKDPKSLENHTIQKSGEGSLRSAMPPSRTNPLFPPLPLYGPASFSRDLQCYAFRISSSILSLIFLIVIVLGAIFTGIPMMFSYLWYRITFRDPHAQRPFYELEKKRAAIRREEEKTWKKKNARRNSTAKLHDDNEDDAGAGEFVPTEGGPDPIVCDVGYYARRVGLDCEKFKVQTEDGFIIDLWHIYNPSEFTPMTDAERAARGPDVFTGAGPSRPLDSQKPKYPVLMIHGLLQSSGVYCSNDDDSLGFYLCKAGYDVWLGNNRSGFKPEHTLLSYSDPRMWAWNIRQMGVMDLPALVSRVLSETGFEKLGLVAHSQGTTQTFVALAKEQRPDLGEKISVFCALAPAAYAGPLIGKAYFSFMRMISPAWFRLIFGIHAFIPLMMRSHQILPGSVYGPIGYRIFAFLFNWSDSRWDRELRDRMFQFAPVYVSAESMRWWLGRECFAKQRCILATREESHLEDREDEMEDYYKNHANQDNPPLELHHSHHSHSHGRNSTSHPQRQHHERKPKGSTAWYNSSVPPFALWVAGSDDLVDGRRLLRRFERGREPHVRLVHSKIIDEYEHLDVIWAMDSIEKVGREIREVLWKTCGVRDKVRIPRGCEEIEAWVDPKGNIDDGEKAKEKEGEDSGQSSSGEDEIES